MAANPPGFVDLKTLDPSIEIEMRYATDWNFTGRPVKGYLANKCYLTREAGMALASAQRELGKQNLGLLILDCYRPSRAVAQFVAWTKNPKDQSMKSIFYPDEPKHELIARGYIADKSGHSRGSTVDLTLVSLNKVQELKKAKLKFNFYEEKTDCRSQKNITTTGQLDMGTNFDCFSVLANTLNPNISRQAQNNRQLLREALEKVGFVNYDKEWWHFTLKNEPFSESYFDFPIK